MLIRLVPLLVLPLVLAQAVPARAAEYPLGGSKLVMADQSPAKRKVTFAGRWTGALNPMPNPGFDGATLRISGNGAGADSGLIKLAAGAWSKLPKNKGFQYLDTTGSASGIKAIVVKIAKKGGTIRINGGTGNFPFSLSTPQTSIIVTLKLGDAQFCTEFAKAKQKGKRLAAAAKARPATCPCEKFDSTWAAIQKRVFDRYSCVSSGCHDAASAPNSGGLDLSPDVAYANLLNVYSEVGKTQRVQPGGKFQSFLWQKLAAGRGEYELDGRGSPMPLGAVGGIGADELEAIAKWIHDGAPETGVVEGTEDLLGSCLPKAEPPAIEPPAPPADGEGVQFHAPQWSIQPPGAPFPAGLDYGDNGEDEVCYATYFNVMDKVPAEMLVDCPAGVWPAALNPSGKCYPWLRQDLTQEPNSHHSIIHMYRGERGVTEVDAYCRKTGAPRGPGCHMDAPDCPVDYTCTPDPSSKGFDFQCHDGEMPTGVSCDPRVADVCPSGQVCRGKVKSSLACLTFGPSDFTDVGSAAGNGAANSPAIGGSQQPFLRRVYPDGVYGLFPVEGVMVWNSHAFNIWDVPVKNQQWLNVYFADPADLTFPVRGIFDSTDIFVQNVPPFEEREYCRTITFPKGSRVFELSSHTHRFGRLFRVFAPPIAEACASADGDTCEPESTTPILVTTQYNDPAQVTIKPTEPYYALDSDDPADRRFKFCAIYDNGFSDPTEVKRNSTSPTPPSFGNLAPGGPCRYTQIGGKLVDEGIACLDGPKKGELCGGDNAVCDSSPGLGDGVCDACPLRGGVTTGDEMYILLGSYYCDDTAPGQTCSGQGSTK